LSKLNTGKRTSKKGKPPGTVMYIGAERSHKVDIDVYSFNSSSFQSLKFEDINQLLQRNPNGMYEWVDVNGIHNTEIIETICRQFDIHQLTAEDIVNTFQRPKFEEFENYLFVTCKMLVYKGNKYNINYEYEQFSLLLTDRKLITFQEKPDDNFDVIRKRFHIQNSRVRQKGPDYLLFLLLDSIVDEFIDYLEVIRDEVEKMDELILEKNSHIEIRHIINQKNQLLNLHKNIFPFRDLILKLIRSESSLIHPSTFKYFNDLHDHVLQVTEQIDLLMNLNRSIQELHFSSLNLKMNKVMEILTVITAIFIPLTFIVGVYGMNFENMPELKHPYGYFAVLFGMTIIAFLMIAWFRRKKWL
jgi:magnesium transporter